MNSKRRVALEVIDRSAAQDRYETPNSSSFCPSDSHRRQSSGGDPSSALALDRMLSDCVPTGLDWTGLVSSRLGQKGRLINNGVVAYTDDLDVYHHGFNSQLPKLQVSAMSCQS